MLRRLWRYVSRMYPPLPRLAAAVCQFYGFYFFLHVVFGKAPLKVDLASLAGCATVFCFLLFLRVSDEFKDRDLDARLFPDRPLPSGLVNERDLRVLWIATIVVMVGLNLVWPVAIAPFALLLGFGLLMYVYFFCRERIAKSLILALVTHNPSAFFLNLYVAGHFCAAQQVPLAQGRVIGLVLLFWVPALLWELARKIRAPADETTYVTYSQIFGYRLAAGILQVVFTVHAAGLLRAMWSHFDLVSFVVIALAYGAISVAIGRFWLWPSTRSAKLQPFAEAYIFICYLTLIVDAVVLSGVEFAWPIS